jgi:hypothetical protein
LADDIRIVGGVAQNGDFRIFRQWQLANQIGGRFGRGAVRQPPLPTVLRCVVRSRKGDPQAGRCDQQAHRKAVATLAGMFLLAVAPSFLRASLTIAGAVGVFGRLPRLGAECGVDDEDEQPLLGLAQKEVFAQDIG